MEVPFVQTLAREMELLSGFRRSHAYIQGDFTNTPNITIGVIDFQQPTSLLIRDLQDATKLDGGHLCFRHSGALHPRRVRILSATRPDQGVFVLTLAESVSTVDGDDCCIEWPE